MDIANTLVPLAFTAFAWFCLISGLALVGFAWLIVVVSNQWENGAARFWLCLITVAGLAAFSGRLLGWFVSLDPGVDQFRRWIVIVALGIEVAPFIVSAVVRSEDFETDEGS